MTASKRQKQMEATVKKSLAPVLREKGPFLYDSSVMVTIMNVKLSPDLSHAKVYVSIYNTEDKDKILEILRNNIRMIKSDFFHRIKNKVRKVPQLEFYKDEFLDEMYHLREVMAGIKTEEE